MVVKILRVTHVEGVRSFHRSSSGQFELNVGVDLEVIDIGGSGSYGESSGTTDREPYNRIGMLGWYASDPVSVDSYALSGLRVHPLPDDYISTGLSYQYHLIRNVKDDQDLAGVTEGVADGQMVLPGGLHLHPIAFAVHTCPNGLDPDICGTGEYTGDPPSEDM